MQRSGTASGTPAGTPTTMKEKEFHKKFRPSSVTQSRTQEKRRWIPICHYCDLPGHIRPRCFRYLADLRRISEKGSNEKNTRKQVWVRRAYKKGGYINGVSSNHVTVLKNSMKNVQPCCSKNVAFGDEVEEKVHGKGVLKVLGSKLDGVSHEEGFDRGGVDKTLRSDLDLCVA